MNMRVLKPLDFSFYTIQGSISAWILYDICFYKCVRINKVRASGMYGFLKLNYLRYFYISCIHLNNTVLIELRLKITIARMCCMKGTDWKLAFGGSVGEIEKLKF